MEIKDKVIPDQKLAVINYKGPIADLDILIAKLMDWVETEKVETLSSPFVIYYSPRASVGQGDDVFDVGIVIADDDVEVNDMIRTVELFEHEVLTGIHEGATDDILDSYAKLVDYSQEHHFDIIGSPKEMLIKNMYNADSEDEYLTEIQLPIIKM